MDDSWEARLDRLESRVERQHRHLELVLTTQRERVDRAFDGVRLAILEQEAAWRSHVGQSREQFAELVTLHRELGSRVAKLEREEPNS